VCSKAVGWSYRNERAYVITEDRRDECLTPFSGTRSLPPVRPKSNDCVWSFMSDGAASIDGFRGRLKAGVTPCEKGRPGMVLLREFPSAQKRVFQNRPRVVGEIRGWKRLIFQGRFSFMPSPVPAVRKKTLSIQSVAKSPPSILLWELTFLLYFCLLFCLFIDRKFHVSNALALLYYVTTKCVSGCLLLCIFF